jgi:hypothetical protein
MISKTVVGLGLFGLHRRAAAPADDLDVALASAQVGLEKKRQRWLLFLIEKEEACITHIAQTAELDVSNEPASSAFPSTASWNLTSAPTITSEQTRIDRNQDSHDN